MVLDEVKSWLGLLGFQGFYTLRQLLEWLIIKTSCQLAIVGGQVLRKNCHCDKYQPSCLVVPKGHLGRCHFPDWRSDKKSQLLTKKSKVKKIWPRPPPGKLFDVSFFLAKTFSPPLVISFSLILTQTWWSQIFGDWKVGKLKKRDEGEEEEKKCLTAPEFLEEFLIWKRCCSLDWP